MFIFLYLFVTYCDHSVSINQLIRITEEKEGVYHAFLTQEYSIKLHSEPTTEDINQEIVEQYFGPVVKLEAWRNRKKIKPKHFSYSFPRYSDVFLSDSKVHKIMFHGARMGDVLRYRITRKYEELAFIPWVLIPGKYHLDEFILRVEYPPDLNIQFETDFPRQNRPGKLVIEDKGVVEYAWGPLPRLNDLDYFAFNNFHGFIQINIISPTGISLACRTPELFYDWYTKALPSSEDLVLPDAFSRDKKVSFSKVFKFISEEIRYVADEIAHNAIIPHDPQFVLDKRFGDCKDKAFLLQSMVGQLKIPSSLALVSTNFKPSFEGISIYDFNHVILARKQDNQWIFSDPTQVSFPSDSIPDYLNEKSVLILEPEGCVLARVTEDQEPELEVVLSGDLKNCEKMELKVTLRGINHHHLKYLQRNDQNLNVDFFLSKLIHHAFPKMGVSGFRRLHSNESESSFSGKASISKWVITSPKRTYLTCTPFDILEPGIFTREKDAFPVYLHDRENWVLELRLTHQGWEQPELPVVKKGKLDFFKVEQQCITSRNDTTLVYSLKLNQPVYKAETKKQLFEFLQTYKQIKRTKITFQRIN